MQTAAANKGMKTKTKTCYDGTMPGSVNIEGQKNKPCNFHFFKSRVESGELGLRFLGPTR